MMLVDLTKEEIELITRMNDELPYALGSKHPMVIAGDKLVEKLEKLRPRDESIFKATGD